MKKIIDKLLYGIILIILIVCTYQGIKYYNLYKTNKELNSLLAQYNQLTEEIELYQQTKITYEQTTTENNNLVTNNNDLKTKIEELKKEITYLNDKIKDINQKLNNL